MKKLTLVKFASIGLVEKGGIASKLTAGGGFLSILKDM